MAKSKTKEYKSYANISKISATSRISLKIGDTFYTLEYSEERVIPDAYMPDFNIEKERELLWDTVNAEVDKQAEDVQKLFKK